MELYSDEWYGACWNPQFCAAMNRFDGIDDELCELDWSCVDDYFRISLQLCN